MAETCTNRAASTSRAAARAADDASLIDRIEFVERHPPGKLGSRVRVSFTRSEIGQ
jgi:hypothetical protein